MAVKRETLAWCAGVLDVAGSIGAHRRTIRWQLHSHDVDLLNRLAAVLGGNVVGPYAHRYADGHERRPRYIWHIDGSFAVATTLRRLRPWLSASKIALAEQRLGALTGERAASG